MRALKSTDRFLRSALAFAAAALACLPILCPGADDQGKFIQGAGVGALGCPAYVEAMNRAKGYGAGSVGYVTETRGFLMYVLGFQTAYNLQTPETCDIFGAYTPDQILDLLATYCTARPYERFGSAVIALAKQLQPRRTTSCG
jgi:hypothetical protein